MICAMFEPTPRFYAVVAEIDAANASDPRTIVVGGAVRPYEIVYAERMGERLTSIYPEASELLRIAAHAQHIRRWDIPRLGYPEGRRGYNDWRKACREHHARLVTGIMTSHGYREDEIQHVIVLIKKEQLKKDKESQALENVVAVVFLEHYFNEFHSKHDHYSDDKIVDIIGKTLRKMSPKGHSAALALALPKRTRKLVEAALAREAPVLEKLASVAID